MKTTAAFACLLAFAGTCGAQTVLYDTFNEGDQANLFDCCNVVQLPGKDPEHPESKAYLSFTPASDARIVEIDLAVSGSNDGTNLRGRLYGINKGLKRSWRMKTLPAEGQCCTYVALTDRNGVEVRAGMPYRLEIVEISPLPAVAAWSLDTAGITGDYSYRSGTKGWTKVDDGTLPAIRIIGK